MAGKRSSKATGKIKPKKLRITAKQKAARKINIEVARRHRKKRPSKKAPKGSKLGGFTLSKTGPDKRKSAKEAKRKGLAAWATLGAWAKYKSY